MQNQREPSQIVRELMSETLTPEEERAVRTWMASRPQDEMKAIREGAPAARDVGLSLKDLRERHLDPAAPEVQALMVRENELAVRYGLRNHTTALIEWNTPVAVKWLQFGWRVMSRIGSSQAAPDEGLGAYHRAAQVASPWHRALEPIVDEAAVLLDKEVQPSSAPAQALVARLRHVCVDHSLGDPLVYARWARALLLRWPAEDNARKQAGWAFLADGVKVTAQCGA